MEYLHQAMPVKQENPAWFARCAQRARGRFFIVDAVSDTYDASSLAANGKKFRGCGSDDFASESRDEPWHLTLVIFIFRILAGADFFTEPRATLEQQDQQ